MVKKVAQTTYVYIYNYIFVHTFNQLYKLYTNILGMAPAFFIGLKIAIDLRGIPCTCTGNLQECSEAAALIRKDLGL
jgi:hypothetical protein